MTQNQHCNNDNDDEVLHVNMWLNIFSGLIWCQNLCYMGGICDNKWGDLNWAHPFARIAGYKRRSDITEGDITEAEVYFPSRDFWSLYDE